MVKTKFVRKWYETFMESQDLHLSREEWINACQFHTLTEDAVLREIRERVREIRDVSPSRHPTVVLDLDSTLYEVAPRTLTILREWATAERNRFPRVAEFLLALDLRNVHYSVKDTLRSGGDHPEFSEAIESLHAYWFERFFTNEYLVWDRPYPGTVQFVQEVHEAGAQIVYLTGRDRLKMESGTRQNLLRDGFPLEDEAIWLVMKEAPLDDVEYKSAAAEQIMGRGTVVASFENEPRNLIALSKCFPGALHVFVDTVCSPLPAPRGEGLYRIKKFSTEEQT